MIAAQNELEQRAAAKVTADPDGTVVIRFALGIRLDGQNTVAVIRAHIAAAAGKKQPAFVDARGVRSTTREARELAVCDEVVAITSRMAVLVDNPVSRVLGNFFMVVTSPRYPTKLFSDEAAARAWLREPQ